MGSLFLFEWVALFNMTRSLAAKNLRISTPLLQSFLAFFLTVFFTEDATVLDAGDNAGSCVFV